MSSTVILHFHSPNILTLALEKLFHPSFSLIFSNLLCCTFSLSLSRVYEEHILATGSLDERIFTGEGASEEIGTPGPCLCEGLDNQNSAISRLHVSLTVRQQARVFMLTVSHLFLIFYNSASLWPSGLSSEGCHSSNRKEIHSGKCCGISYLNCHEQCWASSHTVVRDPAGAKC